MSATCGPTGSNLSEQYDRQLSLANKLRRRLVGVGSTLFNLTWSRKATPYGRPYYQLAASARRISDSVFGSWPTPNAGPQNDGDTTWQSRQMDLKAKHGNGTGFGMTLGQASQLTAWPTARDWKSSASNQHGINARPLNEVARLASWPTATVHDAGRGGQSKRATGETRHGSNLQDFALLASWATMSETVLGPISPGSPAPMEKRGQLNPAFSLWLMGYPPEWESCAQPATRSSRKSRRNS
jgi:hypothetical protein